MARNDRLESAGAEAVQAAQVRMGSCHYPLWPQLSPVPSSLTSFFVFLFVFSCFDQAPELLHARSDGKGMLGTLLTSPSCSGSRAATYPLCYFAKQQLKLYLLCKSQPNGYFYRNTGEAFACNHCPGSSMFPLMLAKLCGLFPARSCGVSIRPRRPCSFPSRKSPNKTEFILLT